MGTQAPKRKIMTMTLVESEETSAKRQRTDAENVASTSEEPAQDSLQQSFQKAFIPPPIPQNTINVRLDEILTSNGNIASVQAQNYIGQHNQRSCRLRTLTKENQCVWKSTLLSQINIMVASEDWIALASQIGEFFCFSTMSGAFVLSLRLDYPIVKIMLNKKFCGLQNTNDQIIVWNFEQRNRVAAYKMPSSLLRSSDKIANYFLSHTGLPVVFLKNGEVWYYSNRQAAWCQIQTGIDMITSFMINLEFIKKVATTGLISKIIINKKQLKPAALPSALVAENVEEEQIELLLGALDEMNYPEEYLLLATMYVHRLVSRGKSRRLYTYMNLLEKLSKDSTINAEILQTEIEELLSKYPLIRKEVAELPAKLDAVFCGDGDLGFL